MVAVEILMSAVTAGTIVRFNVITESQPAAFVVVKVAVLFEDEYVFPSNQVIALQDEMMSVELVAFSLVKFKVITESQPAAFVVVNVAVLFVDEYVFPSNHVIALHDD